MWEAIITIRFNKNEENAVIYEEQLEKMFEEGKE